MLRTSPYFYLSLHSCVGLFLYPQFFSSRMRFFFSWSVNSRKMYEIWDFWLIILQLGSFKFYCFTHLQSRILQVRVFVSPSFPFFPLLLVNILIDFFFVLSLGNCSSCIKESMKSVSSCPVCKVPFHRRGMYIFPYYLIFLVPLAYVENLRSWNWNLGKFIWIFGNLFDDIRIH